MLVCVKSCGFAGVAISDFYSDLLLLSFLFFFKQKTAYEMRISDWSSDVCSSDLTPNCRTTAELDVWLGTIHDALAAKGETAGPIPWAVNLVTHSSNVRIADDLALIAEYRVPIVITAMGSPKPAAEEVQGYGGTLIADGVDVRLPRQAVEGGV